MEFGYFQGESARQLMPGIQARAELPVYWAFDAFQGLRDDWSSVGSPKGAYDLGGNVPSQLDGVEFVVGWVEDTLDTWLGEHSGPVSFVHMDLDVYPPTKFVLDRLKQRLQSGSVFLFDELHGFPGWREHEFRALQEAWVDVEYEYVALGPEQALLRIL